MDIGAAREKQKDYQLAVQAYETAADRYSAQPDVAATALYKAALAWSKQAHKADYDQSAAGQAIVVLQRFHGALPQGPAHPGGAEDHRHAEIGAGARAIFPSPSFTKRASTGTAR